MAAALLAPDCQRLCLGTCHYDWSLGYCWDSRVARLGAWDPLPWGYIPPAESSYPAWVLPYPMEWGSYPLEREPFYVVD